MKKIIPCLWFDHQAEEAAQFYTSIFKNSQVIDISYFPENSPRPQGSVMLVRFSLNGNLFSALNGGSEFKFTPAISFEVGCETQEEIDYLWERLSDGGETDQCGWLKDKYGISWQIVPTILDQLLIDPDPEKANRVFQAMLKMVKLDIPELLKAYKGEAN